jgi:hypothetical protein
MSAASPVPDHSARLAESLRRIRAEALALPDAAENVGIDMDGLLGNWVRSQQSAMFGVADAVEALDQGVCRSLQNTRDLAIKEVHKLHAANDLAQQAIEAFKVKGVVLERQAELATGQFMERVEPRLIDALRTVSVVRQRQWNQRQNITGVSVAAAVILGVFAAGYLWGDGDFQSKAPGRAAKAAVARCLAAAQPDRTSGEKWCPVKVLDELG